MVDMLRLKKAGVPRGFRVCGIHSGIKKTEKKDLGLIYSKFPCLACGMFTSNKTQSDSLKVCRQHLKNRHSRAIIANSGNANCFAGERGIQDTLDIIETLASQLGIPNKSVLIASTGIIGRPLPVKIIEEAIPKLCQKLNKGKLNDFADSILTTDTFRKVVSLKLKIKNKPVLITGIVKGAGMIYPHLETSFKKHATMLAFILTDAVIKKTLLESALKYGVDRSFNRITIDGCTSTNDTVLVLANGAAANVPIGKKDRDFELFNKSLFCVCLTLAQMIVDDAEGKTKRIEILVRGAESIKEAYLAADAVANYSLFKAAMFGGNPNWGRIVAAIGAAGISVDQMKLEISFNKKRIFSRGNTYDLRPRNSLMISKVIFVDINFNKGKFSHLVKTCDLTPEYVNINAEYS